MRSDRQRSESDHHHGHRDHHDVQHVTANRCSPSCAQLSQTKVVCDHQGLAATLRWSESEVDGQPEGYAACQEPVSGLVLELRYAEHRARNAIHRIRKLQQRSIPKS